MQLLKRATCQEKVLDMTRQKKPAVKQAVLEILSKCFLVSTAGGSQLLTAVSLPISLHFASPLKKKHRPYKKSGAFLFNRTVM